jgi:tetratricopeptide (TPR) repeat protein
MEYFNDPETKKDLHSIIESIKKDPIFFEPGEDRQYSNSGYVLLGGVIEKVSGDSYFENVKNRIIIPLKLENTYVQNVGKYRSRRATGYFKTAFGELMTNEKFIDNPNPDGGFLSDAYDLLTFYRSYFYDELLLSKSIKKADPFFEFVVNLPPGKAPLIAGGFEGFNTAFFQVYQEDISIIVLCNMDEPAGENLASGILQVIQGKAPEKPSLPAVQNIAKAYQEKGIAYVKNNFEKLTTNFHPSDPKDIILNMLGYAFMYQKEDIDSAIEIFTLNTKMFPFIANVWDSLGEAWANKGIKSKAIESYQQALQINPDLESAKNALQELEKSKSSH